ncbi:MAG: efflux RND transporter permease subunit [bacterium]|nr:efflux RND transporter permease subunit [bacterium]
MNNIRQRIDQAFEAWANLTIRFKWVFLIFLVLLTGALGSQLRFLTMDTSTEGFFHPDDPNIVAYEAFRDQFGRDEMLILLIKSEQIFSLPFLEKLKALHLEIENSVPNLKDVNSLYNARKTTGVQGALIVEDLMAEMPQTDEEVAALKDYVIHNRLYHNFLIDEKGQYTAIMIQTSAYSSLGQSSFGSGFDTGTDLTEGAARKPITDAENSAIVKKVAEIKDKYESPGFHIAFTGSPVVTEYLKASMQKDMRFFTLLSIGAIVFFLSLTFRRFSGVLLPLLTVVLSFVYTLGLMAFTGTPVKLPTQIMPSFLLAVGIGASVHMMSMFYKDFQRDKGNKEQAIKDAMHHSGLPVAMTSITTAAGLLSFAGAKVAPISDLGIFAAFGVMVALFMTLTMIPTVLAILPVRSQSYIDKGLDNTLTDRFLVRLGDFAFDHYKPISILGILVILVSLYGASLVRLQHNVLVWFPEDSAVRMQSELMDREMKGTVSAELLIDTGKENGLYDPKVLNALAELETFAMTLEPTGGHEGDEFVGKSLSLATMLREINQALNENRPEAYVIPQNRELIAQEFLLFENSGSDDLEDQVDSQFSKTRLTAKMPWIDSMAYIPILDQLQAKAEELLGPDVKVQTTGMTTLFAKTMTLMIHTMIQSYGIAALVITVLMILLMGNLKLGLISMIPNLSPIVLTIGLMGFMGVPMDMFTLLTGSIALGLAVDDTIHFFHNYRRYFAETGDSKRAIELTLSTAGRAMLTTSIVLTLGFWLYMLADMNNLFNFGFYTGLALLFAFFGDVVLSSALLTWMDLNRQRKKRA